MNELIEIEKYFKGEIDKCLEIYKRGFITLNEFNQRYSKLYSMFNKVRKFRKSNR